MKMGCFLTSGIFWGVIIVLVGISIILKGVFKIDIPVFKILWGLLFIYIGLSILTGGFGWRNKCRSYFGDINIAAAEAKEGEYSVIFGKGVVDLTEVGIKDKPAKVRVSAVFGEAIVKIDKKMPVKVYINAAFAGARTPDNNNISFGNYVYQTKSAKKADKYLEVDVHTVFGGVNIVEK